MPNSVVAVDAWTELACYPRSSFYLLIFGLILVSTIGSLSSAFAPARHTRLAVRLAYAFTRPSRFPSGTSQPYKPLHYLLGALCPTQTARQTLSPRRLAAQVRTYRFQEGYFTDGSSPTGIGPSNPPLYATHENGMLNIKLQ